MRIVLLLCVISFFISCRNEAKKELLSPEKMEVVLLDFVMAEAYTNTHVPIDSQLLAKKENVKLQKKIFALHGISKEQFENSFDYYTKHSADFIKILDSIIAKENRRNTQTITTKYE